MQLNGVGEHLAVLPLPSTRTTRRVVPYGHPELLRHRPEYPGLDDANEDRDAPVAGAGLDDHDGRVLKHDRVDRFSFSPFSIGEILGQGEVYSGNVGRLRAVYDEQRRAWREEEMCWLRAFVEVSAAGLMGLVICSIMAWLLG